MVFWGDSRLAARGRGPCSSAGKGQRVTEAKSFAAMRIRAYLGLGKPGVSLLMAASCYASYSISGRIQDGAALGAALGVFLLSAGGASLNNYQDRHLDASLVRTRTRPLPSGTIAPRHALVQGAALILGGTLALYVAVGSPGPPGVGLLAVGLYNFAYTPLKRHTVFALVPGAICGAMPVLVGWTAAGSAISPRTWMMMAVLAVWQLPHFWLVVLAHRADYSKVELPSMLRLFSTAQLRRLVFIWTAVFAVMTLLLPLFEIVITKTAAWLLVANALTLIALVTYRLIIRPHEASYRPLFRALNASAALVMGLIVLGSVLSA